MYFPDSHVWHYPDDSNSSPGKHYLITKFKATLEEKISRLTLVAKILIFE